MKNRYFFSVVLLSILALISCNRSQTTAKKTSQSKSQAQENVRIYSVQSVLWVENAGEYKALCYQAFNTAKLRLDIILKNHDTDTKNLAIITDIDETVLNNSPFEAKSIEINQEYTPKTWDKWVQMESAKAIPGATDFLNYAKSKAVEVFYVSNRSKNQKEATIANMKKVNFPYADTTHLLFKDSTDAKKGRFEKIEKTHDVLLFMGDNLADFLSKFNVSSTKIRNQMADSLKAFFGSKFIVLPNPMYGGWEHFGIYQGRYDWTEAQKDSIRKAALKAY